LMAANLKTNFSRQKILRACNPCRLLFDGHLNSLRNNGFKDFVNRPKFYITKERNISETESVFVFGSGEGNTYSVGSLRKS
jgi:hypothetical protein